MIKQEILLQHSTLIEQNKEHMNKRIRILFITITVAIILLACTPTELGNEAIKAPAIPTSPTEETISSTMTPSFEITDPTTGITEETMVPTIPEITEAVEVTPAETFSTEESIPLESTQETVFPTENDQGDELNQTPDDEF